MKYFSGTVAFQFTWNQVAQAYWKRYPNPYSGHVLTEDTIKRHVGSDNKLYSTRVITKTNKLPKWGERFVPHSTRTCCVVEESIVDPVNKTLTTYTRNIGLTKIMTVDEKCVYKLNPVDLSTTICEREAWISSSLLGFSYAIQAFGFERFKSNASKMVKGFEHVLSKLYIPETLVADRSRQLTTVKLKDTAIKAKIIAKEKVAAVATYTGTTAS